MSDKYNITINYVTGWGVSAQPHTNPHGGFIIGWSAEGIGFGQLTVYDEGDGKQITSDSECMGQEFCEAVLEALANKWTLRD